MPIRAQMADGNVLEFPDGTPDEVVDRAAQEYARSGSPGMDYSFRADAPETLSVKPRTGLDLAAAGRGAADVLTADFADEAFAALKAGAISGPEYEAILAEEAKLREQDRLLSPGSRQLGEIAGAIGTMAVPFGAVSRVAGTLKQMGAAGLAGGAMQALSGAGAAGPGQRTENLVPDAFIGALVGGASVPVASVARRVVQGLTPGARANQTLADDALIDAEIDPADLRRRAAEYYQRTGQGARIADLLSPEEGARLTSALGRSPQARARITGELEQRRRELPTAMAQRIDQGGTATSVAEEQAALRAMDKANYGAVEKQVVPLNDVDRMILERDILPYVSLPKATRDKLLERFSDNKMTGLDFQNLRNSLSRFSGQVEKSGRAYDDLVAEVDAIIEPNLPAFRAAREASAAQRSRIEGVELGQRAATPSQQPGEIIGEVQNARPLQQPGIEPGARGGLINRAMGDPLQAYHLAGQLDANPGFQSQVRAALPQDADAIIGFAVEQKKAIDGLAALAKIPQDKVESVLNNAEQMADWGSALSGGAGAAFRANLADQIFRMLRLGRGAADKLAEDLLNPNRRDRVFGVLEKAGMPRAGARQVLQSAIISTSNALFTADRELLPEEPQ